MPICPICDDTGLQNSDSEHPEFCYCAAGKQARRQWEASRVGGQEKNQSKTGSFIDIGKLDEVNASVDAMRASLLGSVVSETSTTTKHAAVQLLYQVAHANHEVSAMSYSTILVARSCAWYFDAESRGQTSPRIC